MNSSREMRCEVAIVGAGPAGIAAAVTAAGSGATVVLVDDNPAAGGQIWRGGKPSSPAQEVAEWFDRLGRSSVRLLCNTRVFHLSQNLLFAEAPHATLTIAFEKLILATGARERFLPFPGWTLPNVLGVGALQAFIKSGLSVGGKRIVIAGTGPLLFAAADCAREHGAHVVAIAEQSPWPQYAGFAARMLLQSGRRREAIRLATRLAPVPHWKNSWPLRALGKQRLEGVRLRRSGKTIELSCDYLACGFHLVPNIELPSSLGCKIEDGFVAVDSNQQTSLPCIYCVGEPTGIAGVEAALLDGQIAGFASTDSRKITTELRKSHATSRRVVQTLRQATHLRPELREMPAADTIVCRCEDVRLAQLRSHHSGPSAKLQSRCGMGPCQARVCGPIVDFLFGWNLNRQRPPLFPVECSSLAAIGAQAETPSTNSSLEDKQ